MSNESSGGSAAQVAEEILRTIYGEDLTGCGVSLDSIAALIARGMGDVAARDEMLSLHEKVIEAVHLLSVPPPLERVTDTRELQDLLSQRLDSIHTVTTKTLETLAAFKSQFGERK